MSDSLYKLINESGLDLDHRLIHNDHLCFGRCYHLPECWANVTVIYQDVVMRVHEHEVRHLVGYFSVIFDKIDKLAREENCFNGKCRHYHIKLDEETLSDIDVIILILLLDFIYADCTEPDSRMNISQYNDVLRLAAILDCSDSIINTISCYKSVHEDEVNRLITCDIERNDA